MTATSNLVGAIRGRGVRSTPRNVARRAPWDARKNDSTRIGEQYMTGATTVFRAAVLPSAARTRAAHAHKPVYECVIYTRNDQLIVFECEISRFRVRDDE